MTAVQFRDSIFGIIGESVPDKLECSRSPPRVLNESRHGFLLGGAARYCIHDPRAHQPENIGSFNSTRSPLET